MKDIIFTLT